MSSMLTQIEEVTAKRRADAAAAYDAALATADVDPDVIAYLETLDNAATDRPASPADVVRLEKVLDRLGRTIADFKHDVGVRQRVAKLRASRLTAEQEANLDAERQAAEDAYAAGGRAALRRMVDGVSVENLHHAARLMSQVAFNLGSTDANPVGEVNRAASARDGEVARVASRIERSHGNAALADELEKANPRAFPPAA